MSTKPDFTKVVAKRLIPLYIAAFFQGFVLWYAVEKLFMKSIGFDDAGIGIMVAAYSGVMLVVETPSGILADRWSRKGVLVLASVALMLCAVVGGVSTNIAMYVVATLFWGVFFALYSGTYDSIVYDVLLEETKNADSFEKYFGKVKVMDSSALVISSLLGGAVGSLLGLRWAYFLSIPFAICAIFALAKLREPVLHKAVEGVPLREHVATTFRAVARNRSILPVLAILVMTSTITYLLFEFDQLWLIALGLPVAWFGVANAAILTTTGIGGGIVGYLRLHKLPVTLVILLCMLGSALGLVTLRNVVAVIASQVVLLSAVAIISIVYNRKLHDALHSGIRAGATSAVSTFTRVLIIPLALLFGYVSKEMGIFKAAWILVVLVALAVLGVLLTTLRQAYAKRL